MKLIRSAALAASLLLVPLAARATAVAYGLGAAGNAGAVYMCASP